MASSNLDRLVEARVIPSADALSAPERKVVDGLSEEEVATLIGIRRKLSGELAGQLGREASDPEAVLKSNVVI